MKILIIKTSSLGDIIHVFPVLRFLRMHYPHAQIDWVVEKPFSELVKAHPDINQVWTVETKKWRQAFWKKETWLEIATLRKNLRKNKYDVVFDLQGNIKSGLVNSLVKSKNKVGFGWSTLPEKPNFLFTNKRFNPPSGKNIREDYLYLVKKYFCQFDTVEEGVKLHIKSEEKEKIQSILALDTLSKGKKIMVCPGSLWTNKQLPTETLIAFLHQINKNMNCSFLFIWGSLEEKNVGNAMHQEFPDNSLIVEKLSLPTLQNLMESMDLVIAMDSLPLHLAATAGVPTYSFFGSSSANKYKPLGVQHRAFQGTCPYGQKFEKRCPILRTCKTGACIKEIKEDVIYQDFLNAHRR